MQNLILDADSYKASHYLQYPPGTRFVSSYVESRGGAWPQTVFFGLQMFLKERLSRPIGQTDIDEAQAVIEAHGLPFNRAGWQYILDRHGGYLPLKIQAAPEGTVLPVRNVMVQVVNTDPQVPWLTSYIETALLRAIWYPTTVATVSWQVKQVIRRYLEATADSLEGLPFKLHDFGARGVSSRESAAIGGAAHLVNFMGSDTLSGILAARRYYGESMAGFSIPAAEHSTITAWGREGEQAAYANMLDRFAGPGRLVAVVSDSYDLWRAIDQLWGEALRDRVEASGGTLVVRPDSGDPVSVIVEAIERLMARFGHRTNRKGYRVLPDCVRVIQGDGVSPATIEAMLDAMQKHGLSAENVAFGMGGELLQKINRDTLKFAMKASAIDIGGRWHDVSKDPVTDRGKRSRAGRLALVQNADGEWTTVREAALAGRSNGLLTVWQDGELRVDWSFDEIRQRAG